MKRLHWANTLRGLAAFMVMLGHLLVGFVMLNGLARSWVRYPGDALDPTVSSPASDALRGLPFDVTAVGVALFFLLSGLVISRSLQQYSRSGFLVGRLMRLLPTYAAGYLVICAAVILLALVRGYDIPVSPGEVVVGVIPGLPVLVGVGSVTNTVAWTLVVEFAFYGVCLALHRSLLSVRFTVLWVALGCVVLQALALRLETSTPLLAGCAALILVAAPFLPILMIGVVFGRLGEGDRLGPGDVLAAAAMLACFLWMTRFRVWWPFSPLGTEGAGLTYQLTFVVTVALFFFVWRYGGRLRDSAVTSWLADISYPLYVVHLMVGYVVLFGLISANVPLMVAQIGSVAAVLLVAWALHRCVEAPTHRVGRRWARALSRADAGAGGGHRAAAAQAAAAQTAPGSTTAGAGEVAAAAPSARHGDQP